jgi:hypothetical protein
MVSCVAVDNRSAKVQKNRMEMDCPEHPLIYGMQFDGKSTAVQCSHWPCAAEQQPRKSPGNAVATEKIDLYSQVVADGIRHARVVKCVAFAEFQASPGKILEL